MDNYPFIKLPPVGAWRLLGAYEGHEVVCFTTNDKSIVLEGTTVGVEEGIPWSIHYVIDVTDNWHVGHATITDHAGNRLEIQTNGKGVWKVNGEHHPNLEGCLDLDFEASVVTNTLPVHRLSLSVGQQGESLAVYIRTNGLVAERLAQTYRRLPDSNGKILFDYESLRFGYHDTLYFGSDGLVVNYPGIGERVSLKV